MFPSKGGPTVTHLVEVKRPTLRKVRPESEEYRNPDCPVLSQSTPSSYGEVVK